MKHLSVLLSLLLPVCASAETFKGSIYAIDPKTDSLIVGTQKKKQPKSLRMQTYRVRLDSTITLNGAPAKFEDLNLGMRIQVFSGDPSIATRITAYGLPRQPVTSKATPAPAVPAADVASPSPTAQLANTRWKLSTGKIFTLNGDGTTSTTWGKHKGQWQKGSWNIVGDDAIQLWIPHWHPKYEQATVDTDATSLHWDSGTLTALRLPN